ncbi:MAG: acyl-ACP desaturase [Armatimonadota bacterium]
MAAQENYETYDTTAKQNATNEKSAAARMDRATEDRLYKLFRDFFQEAEQNRRWNLWNDFAWDTVPTSPSPALLAAVTRAYHDELFLPDYSARALYHLRSSRGRAWFVTRWTYEEGKHLLVLAEWLMRCGAYTNDQLRAQSDDLLLRYTWEPPYEDAPAVLADFLLWELKEQDRYESLRKLAQAEGDDVLASVLVEILKDEEAHRSFLHQSLRIIADTYPEQVADAARRIAAINANGDDGPSFGNALLAELGIAAEPATT